MNRKGLASGLLAIIIVLFFFAIISLISLAGWNLVNSTLQDVDNSTISPSVKTQIDGLSSFMGWGDRIFLLFFIALLIGFMVTSFSLSTDKTIYIVLYFIMLVFISVVSMIVSNGWSYLVENPNFIEAAADMPFTTWFFTYLPVVIFFIGLIGGVIFYARKQSSPTGNGYNIDFGSGGGDIGGGFE